MYAAAVKKGNENSLASKNNGEFVTDVGISTNQRNNKHTSSKPKYVWRRDSSYDGWERAYFRELLELRDIYIERLGGQNVNYLYSAQFQYKFNQFIYKNSSTTVSKFLDSTSSEIDNIYREYKEMREKINECDE
jgi:hypothetical protein